MKAPSESHPHVPPAWVLLGTFAALLALTWITVAATHLDLGRYNIALALAVAVVKAGLVALFFMHLRWDSPFNGVVLIVAMLFVMLFISLALLDTRSYQSDIRTYEQAQQPASP